jgi:hypothetical protein
MQRLGSLLNVCQSDGGTVKSISHDRSIARALPLTWMATYMAGTLKVSNMMEVIFSRLILQGGRGRVEGRTRGVSSGEMPLVGRCRYVREEGGVTSSYRLGRLTWGSWGPQ